MTSRQWNLVVAGPAARALSEQIPEKITHAIVEFIYSSLLKNPHQVGYELKFELSGFWSAKRGAYRIIYKIDENSKTVEILDIAHRADVYRSD